MKKERISIRISKGEKDLLKASFPVLEKPAGAEQRWRELVAISDGLRIGGGLVHRSKHLFTMSYKLAELLCCLVQIAAFDEQEPREQKNREGNK